jgi:acyl carrier protein
MNTLAEQQLIELVVQWVRNNRLPSNSNHIEISENTNLLESGLLDSFSFVDLILFLETSTGAKMDLIDVNPEEFTVVKSLCRLALRNGH